VAIGRPQLSREKTMLTPNPALTHALTPIQGPPSARPNSQPMLEPANPPRAGMVPFAKN
jgi:hypothetical protein